MLRWLPIVRLKASSLTSKNCLAPLPATLPVSIFSSSQAFKASAVLSALIASSLHSHEADSFLYSTGLCSSVTSSRKPSPTTLSKSPPLTPLLTLPVCFLYNTYPDLQLLLFFSLFTVCLSTYSVRSRFVQQLHVQGMQGQLHGPTT